MTGEMVGVGFVVVFMIIIIGLLVARIVFFSHLEQLFNEIKFENRTMPSGQVWLLLIPCFGIIWLFIVIERLSDSLRKEFADRGLSYTEAYPGKKNGMLMAGFGAGRIVPYLGILSAIVFIILWFIYWAEIKKIKEILNHGYYETDLLDSPIGYIES